MSDKQIAIDLAKQWLQMPNALILDTETNGFTGQVLELAIIDLGGNELFNSRFCTSESLNQNAIAVHGLTQDVLHYYQTWHEQHPLFSEFLNRPILIYNADFDTKRMNYTNVLHDLDPLNFNAYCVMKLYAQYYGEWNSRFRNYKYQPLTGGDHSALGDAQATLALLKRMAEGE